MNNKRLLINTFNSEIRLIGQSLSEGQTIRTTCPYCAGGSSQEKSLGISLHEGTLLWQCFRAKCGIKGAQGGTFTRQQTALVPRAKWEGVCHELPPKVAEVIYKKWGILNPPHWYWTTDYGGRVAMSVRSPNDQHRGWVLRALVSTQRTKALTFIDEGEEGLSWYKTHPFAPIVVVEDIPSAVRASKHVNSVALLGTGIGMARAVEISDSSPRPIILALDNDATNLSFRWARKYSLLWEDVKVLPLKQDLKDMDEAELQLQLQQWHQAIEDAEEDEGETCTSKRNQIEESL